VIDFDKHACALMYIPVDNEKEIENHLITNNMDIEGMGLMAKTILGVPLTLMTECAHEYNDVLEVIVYHLGQDGRLPLNMRASVGLQEGFGIPNDWEGDIVIGFSSVELVM
tara:strand:- start:4216 stop:4548 length:333 start_codon:yes stop_codon:yes gene_type:complete